MSQPFLVSQANRSKAGAQAADTSQADSASRVGPSAPPTYDPQLIAAIRGLDANGGRALANRTRRVVHDAAQDIEEGHHRRRRSSAIALLVLAGMFMLLSPAIWNSVDDLLGGEPMLDLPGMVAALAFTLFAAIAAVLFLVSGQNDRDLRHSRR